MLSPNGGNVTMERGAGGPERGGPGVLGNGGTLSPSATLNGGIGHHIGHGHRYMNQSHPRLNHSHGLNISTLSTSKHSLGGNSSSVSPLGMTHAPSVHSHHGPKMANGGLNISRTHVPVSPVSPGAGPATPARRLPERAQSLKQGDGVKEQLTSLGLLCLTSLMVAMLALIFLLKISPVTPADVRDLMRNEQLTVISPDEYITVYEVTLALCALSLSLNLCCLLVCSVQFLFAVKLVRTWPNGERSNIFLQKSSITRVCAIGGFFISIPVFLTGIILYTLIQFHSTPAIITSALIGLGIVFCGCAMVHNVFIWQKEKTNAVKELTAEKIASQRGISVISSAKLRPLPNATLDLSSVTTTPHELSTLV